MDNIRFALWMGLGLLIWLSFQAWKQDFTPTPAQMDAENPPPAQSADQTPGKASGADDLPSLPNVSATPKLGEQTPPAAKKADVSPGKTIHVRTDVLDLEINLDGGDLQSAALLRYPVHKDRPDDLVQLLSSDPDNIFVFGSGLRSLDGAAEPNHQSTFTADRDDYVLADGQEQLVVTLNWQGEGGVSARKTYQFKRGSYAIGLNLTMQNDGVEPYHAVSYLQIKRHYTAPHRTMFDIDTYSFVGPVVYDGEKYEKLKAKDLGEKPFEQSISGGWIASIQHHFLVAAVPSAGVVRKFTGVYDEKNAFTLVRILDTQATSIAPGDQATFESTLFVGPKLQAQLAKVAEGLKLTVDYGRLTVLAQPLFWLLQKIYNVTGNWGWTIIIVTFLIKLTFYKLTEKSGRSMAKMRKIAPRLKAVQARHKDDREALSRAMMELYKREKVNPAAGCWPMLIQIPFFISFYWVLVESVEMRQAPFMLWITDLSTRDPFFILPLLMGAAMFFQQKLNPPPPDPMQAKVMQFLPIAFTAMFAFFPAGLVLYWLTNSVLSMAQQWRINKVIGAD